MTKNKDMKRAVRARMNKTGESGAAARAHMVRSNSAKSWPELAGMSDEAVRRKTGKDWTEWVKWLDDQRASSLTHPQIARLALKSFPEIGGWWAQTVTVAYERIRGLREVGQRRDTRTFDANKSRTMLVNVSTLYAAFAQKRQRQRWLNQDVTVRTSRRDQSMRLRWSNGTSVSLYFVAKGADKSSVSLQHSGHATKSEADAAMVFWQERLLELGRLLRSIQ